MKGLVHVDVKRLIGTLKEETPDTTYILMPAMDRYKGNVVLVAHMDTVNGKLQHKVIPSIKDGRIKNVNLANRCLGADDRAGVYAVKHIHKLTGAPVIITTGEESGGIGVKELCSTFTIEQLSEELGITDIRLFLEMDRQGFMEYVTYTDEPLTETYIEQVYKLRQEWGTYSDVSDLTDKYNIPHINIAAGYYKEHTMSEYLDITQLDDMIQIALDITNDRDLPIEKVEASTYSSKGWGGYHTSSYSRRGKGSHRGGFVPFNDREWDIYDGIDSYAEQTENRLRRSIEDLEVLLQHSMILPVDMEHIIRAIDDAMINSKVPF